MALSDRLANVTPPTTGTRCSVCRVLDDLDQNDRDALTVALGTPEQRGLTAGAIFDALKADGHTVSFQQINRHRAGRCRGTK